MREKIERKNKLRNDKKKKQLQKWGLNLEKKKKKNKMMRNKIERKNKPKKW